MMNENEVRQAMRARLKTVAGLPASDRRAWEGRTFEPPDLTAVDGARPLWIREIQRVLSERAAATGTDEAVGETLWMVETPDGKGTDEADTLALAIAEAFKPRQSLTKGATTVILERTERLPFARDEKHPLWMHKTVAVRWRVFTAA